MAKVCDLIGMDSYVDDLLKKHKKDEITSNTVLDCLDFYNVMIATPLNIKMFIGEQQMFFGFELMKTDEKYIFMTKFDGKQHMFSYDIKQNRFIGKTKVNDLTNIGLTYKK